MYIRYTVFDVEFLVPSKFLMKGFYFDFYTMHSMLGLDKEARK